MMNADSAAPLALGRASVHGPMPANPHALDQSRRPFGPQEERTASADRRATGAGVDLLGQAYRTHNWSICGWLLELRVK